MVVVEVVAGIVAEVVEIRIEETPMVDILGITIRAAQEVLAMNSNSL